MNPVLSMLGLALRGGRLAVGEEPTALAARAGEARLLVAAQDAGGSTLRRAEHLAEAGHCVWLPVPFTKAELGGALGRGSVAIAAVTDLGLAAAIVKRLAALDSETYEDVSERMALKVRRAAERKKAPRRRPPEKAESMRGSGMGRPKAERFSKERKKQFDKGRGGRPEAGERERPAERYGKRPPGPKGSYRGQSRKEKDRLPQGRPEKRPHSQGQKPPYGPARGPGGRRSGGGR